MAVLVMYLTPSSGSIHHPQSQTVYAEKLNCATAKTASTDSCVNKRPRFQINFAEESLLCFASEESFGLRLESPANNINHPGS